MTRRDKEARAPRPSAIVIGAGVAGLSTAHELASRGFTVHVVEAQEEERSVHVPLPDEGGDDDAIGPRMSDDWLRPAVGGMARSTYAWTVGGTQPAHQEMGTASLSFDGQNFMTHAEEFGHRALFKAAVLCLHPASDADPPSAGKAAALLQAFENLIADDAEHAARIDDTPDALQTVDAIFHRAKHRLSVPPIAESARLKRHMDEKSPLKVPDATHLIAHTWTQWLGAAPAKKPTAGRKPKPPRHLRIGGRIVAATADAAQRMQLALDTLVPCNHSAVRTWLDTRAGRGENGRGTYDFHDIRDEGLFKQSVPAWVPAGTTAVLVLWIEQPNRESARSNGPKFAPGEHGYRFFPSFYEHVFDTMRRTVIQKRGTRGGPLIGGAVRRTVYDNLISQPVAAFGFSARPDGSSPDLAELDRAPSKTLSDGLRLLRTFQKQIGFETRDLLRYQGRILAYLTSCAARREVIAKSSWFDYVRGDDGYSPAFVDALEHWPAALVGMRSREVDARTFGNAELQILFDNVVQGEMRDATLNGPTTNAWFDPWRDFLIEEYGVRFHRDTAVGLVLLPQDGPDADPDQPWVHAIFQGGLAYRKRKRKDQDVGDNIKDTINDDIDDDDDDDDDTCDDVNDDSSSPPDVLDDLTKHYPEPPSRSPRRALPRRAYLVLATSTIETYRLLKTVDFGLEKLGSVGVSPRDQRAIKKAWAKECKDGTVHRLWNVLDQPDGEPFKPSSLTRPKLEGPLRHFIGVQYFDHDVDIPFVRGHLFLPEHPWGLSAISQAQFGRIRRRRGWFPGVMSFDVGSMHRPAPSGPPVWGQTRDGIADEVWSALLGAIPEERGRFRLDPDRPDYRIDSGISFVASLWALPGKEPLVLKPPAWLSPACDIPDGPDCANTDAWQAYYLDPWTLPPDRELLMVHMPQLLSGEPFAPAWPSSDLAGQLERSTPGYNSTPYLIVPPGQFNGWPGDLDPDEPTRGYEPVFRNLTFAGVHMRTFTRLATMESACESGRHAANGILRDYDERRAWRSEATGTPFPRDPRDPTPAANVRGEPPPAREANRFERTGYCDIWPLEEREPAAARFWKDVDARLFAAGLPHMLDILRLDETLKTVLPSGARTTGPSGEEILEGLTRMLSDASPDPKRLSSWVSPGILQIIQMFVSARRG